jgi:hypothetical protein
MKNVINVTKKKKVNLDQFINSDTGELLVSELQKAIIEIKEDTGNVIINYDEYIAIDSACFRFCYENLSIEDFGRLNIMSDTTFTSFNIVCNTNKVPYTDDTLPPFLKLSKDRCTKFIRRLKGLGIVYTVNGLFMGKVQSVYILNPFLSKKRRTIDEKLTTEYFKKLGQNFL